MNGLVSMLLQYLSLTAQTEVTNYLLCDGVGRYLSYYPSPIDVLYPLGELDTKSKQHHYWFQLLLIINL